MSVFGLGPAALALLVVVVFGLCEWNDSLASASVERRAAAPSVFREPAPRRRAILLSQIHTIEGRVPTGPSLGCPALPPDRSAIYTVPKIGDAETIEGAVARAVNELRGQHRLAALRFSLPLARAADAHAEALAFSGSFTHDWPMTPRAPFGRWIGRYYPVRSGRGWSAGENLLWSEGDITPSQAVTLWLNSPSHRRIMLAAPWRELGIGIVRADGAGGVYAGRNVYVVAAEFGAR